MELFNIIHTLETYHAATNNIVQPITSDDAIPPSRPHTMERAFNQGELVTVRWPIMVPPTAPGP